MDDGKCNLEVGEKIMNSKGGRRAKQGDGKYKFEMCLKTNGQWLVSCRRECWLLREL